VTSRPLLVVVDPDPAELGRLADALTRRYSADYEVVAFAGGGEALSQLEQRGGEVALLIAPEDAGGMGALEFFEQARATCATAKRVLVVERRFDSGRLITDALTLGQADYHLARPWRPDRTLYPTVDQFLAEWVHSQGSRFELPHVRVVAHWRTPRGREILELLSRLGMPTELLDASSTDGRELLEQAGQTDAAGPVFLFADGRVLADPDTARLMRAIGVQTSPTRDEFDLTVVGAGPSGLAAAVYAASEGLSTLVVESLVFGGQAASSSRIRNYLGFPRGVRGDELAYAAMEQAWLFGAELVFARAATSLATVDGRPRVTISGGDEIASRAVIVATGVRWRRLDVPALEPLIGHGVFYGAGRLDVQAMHDRRVYIVGGGNSAGQAAAALAERAASVTFVIRGDSLAASMSDYLVSQLESTPNVHVRSRTVVADAAGAEHLDTLTLRDLAADGKEEVAADALFVMIGGEPQTEWLRGAVAHDDRGYVLTGTAAAEGGWPLERPPLLLETTVPAVFAVGDVRHGSVKRVASAVGEGAIAVQLLHELLAGAELTSPGR
jgi:thioredoxin reductase (NADPH)